jgi:hypothetical protein
MDDRAPCSYLKNGSQLDSCMGPDNFTVASDNHWGSRPTRCRSPTR